MTEFAQFVLIGLVIGTLYALIAIGYTMVYGIIELINFAHGDLFMLGSFLALELLRQIGGFSIDTLGGGIISVLDFLEFDFERIIRAGEIGADRADGDARGIRHQIALGGGLVGGEDRSHSGD